MYLKSQDIFTRPDEFLPDMSGGQTEFREDWYNMYAVFIKIDNIFVYSENKPIEAY